MLSPHAPRASSVTSFPARKKFRARLQPSTPAPNTKIFIAKSPLILKIPVSFVLPRLAMLSFRFSFVLRQLVISNRNIATDSAKVKMSFYRSPVLPCPFFIFSFTRSTKPRFKRGCALFICTGLFLSLCQICSKNICFCKFNLASSGYFHIMLTIEQEVPPCMLPTTTFLSSSSTRA